MQENKCPVCLGAVSQDALQKMMDSLMLIACSCCGQYRMHRDVYDDNFVEQSATYRNLTTVVRAAISYWIRRAQPQELRSWNLTPMLDEETVQKFVRREITGPSPAQQAQNLIRLIGDHVSATGSILRSMPVSAHAKVGSVSQVALGRLAIELASRGLIKGVSSSTTTLQTLNDVDLTLDGWERYEAEKRGLTSGNYGFLAMKFGDVELEEFARDVIKPCVNDSLGYQVVDMRDVSRAGLIDNIMREQIRGAAFVLADLTHDNAGAYWEAGMAEGLNKPVVYLCKAEKFDEMRTHFDTNHCTTVMWSTTDPETFKRTLVATLHRSLTGFSR